MLDIDLIKKSVEYLSLDLEKVRKPERWVDFDITSSFAHCTPNLTSDELFGYYFVDKLIEYCKGDINMLLCDYDGTLPEKEKPEAFSLENLLTNINVNFSYILPKSKHVYIPLLFESGIPISLQRLEKEIILKKLKQPWNEFIKASGFKKENIPIVNQRFSQIISIINDSAKETNEVREFLGKIRKGYLSIAGIRSYGQSESQVISRMTQKLEEDFEGGFPYWRIDLPKRFEEKHKSNKGTYLLMGISQKRKIIPVKFYSNPERFEFNDLKEDIVIKAEDSFKAIKERRLIPTSSLLNYIVLSPARKPTTSGRKRRIHIAGQYMAGENGYAMELGEYFNRIPGFDKVTLVCTNYDGSLSIKNKTGPRIGFGSYYPQFGEKGIKDSLEKGHPFYLKRGEVYK